MAERDTRDETVAMSPDDLPRPAEGPRHADDPDATRLADAAPTTAVDPDATRLADAAPTTVVDPGDLPTIVVPSPGGADDTSSAPDGLDVLDDPYYAPPTADDLTSAKAPVSIPSPVQSLPERRRRLPRWAVALIAAVLLACAAGVAWYTYDLEVWGGKTVPDVVGMQQDEAARTLEALGFAVSVEPSLADDGFGTVLASRPGAGERVDPAGGATITVATQRTIPQVVGMGADEAAQALRDAGASDVSLVYQNSEQAPGTVLAVSPGEGEPFVSTDPVTLTVARSFTVPDVMGMALADAQAALDAAGLSSSVTYVGSDAERGTVVATSPEVGVEVAPGSTVELSVASPLPESPSDLLAYFDAVPQALSSYLGDAGFSLVYGGSYAAGGNAHMVYTGSSGDSLQISDSPESAHYAGDSLADMLARGSGVGGVRYAFSTQTLPEGGASESEEGVRAVMAACGLEGLLDTCTQDDVTLPEQERPSGDSGDSGGDAATTGADEGAETGEAPAAPDPAHHFICGYGTQGDYTWAVVIGGYEGSTRVVALAAPTAHFSSVDLTPYGGSVCDYIAYIDQYTG